jgi:integrase
MDLSLKRERERLAVRREPYWQRLAEGSYLGFRAGANTWLARFRGRDGKQRWHPLGEAIGYDEAKRRAESWLTQLSGSAVRAVKRATVRAALETYLTDLRRHGRSDAAKDAEWRFKLYVYKDDVLPDLELEGVTQDDFLEWRDRLRPGRQARTVNRNVRAVVAGLNRANRLGHVGNPSAWRMTALADDVEDDGETAVFLNAEQRAAFIAAASINAGEFLRGMELSGARPGELAAATVGDFDGETLRLAHRKGKPPKLRVRHVVLGEEGITFFKARAADKLPAAFLLTEDGKQPWRRHMWARHVRAAIKKHNKKARGVHRIPTAASAYSFRHARISELLQLHGVDPLTVAIQTGTSLAMIEKSYLRFIPSAMRAKLAGLKESV